MAGARLLSFGTGIPMRSCLNWELAQSLSDPGRLLGESVI
jgi:hypothetical protein